MLEGGTHRVSIFPLEVGSLVNGFPHQRQLAQEFPRGNRPAEILVLQDQRSARTLAPAYGGHCATRVSRLGGDIHESCGATGVLVPLGFPLDRHLMSEQARDGSSFDVIIPQPQLFRCLKHVEDNGVVDTWPPVVSPECGRKHNWCVLPLVVTKFHDDEPEESGLCVLEDHPARLAGKASAPTTAEAFAVRQRQRRCCRTLTEL